MRQSRDRRRRRRQPALRPGYNYLDSSYTLYRCTRGIAGDASTCPMQPPRAIIFCRSTCRRPSIRPSRGEVRPQRRHPSRSCQLVLRPRASTIDLLLSSCNYIYMWYYYTLRWGTKQSEANRNSDSGAAAIMPIQKLSRTRKRQLEILEDACRTSLQRLNKIRYTYLLVI